MTAALERLLPQVVGGGDNAAEWFVHESRITGGAQAGAGWRALLAQTLLRWDEQQRARPI